MNKTDIKGFKGYIRANPPTSLLPQNLPDNWFYKLHDEARIMDYENHKPGENWDAITLATLAICSEKLRQGKKIQLSSEKILDYVQYYANLVMIEAIQRDTSRDHNGNPRPHMFITNNLALPATIDNIFTDRPPKITRITPGHRQIEDTPVPPQRGHTIITRQGATSALLANHIIYENLYRKDIRRIWIIDPTAEYKVFTNLVGGTYTKIAQEAAPSPNPFAAAHGTHYDIRLLLPILEEMASPGQEITPTRAATLMRALKDSMAAHGKKTTVKHIVRMLRQASAAAGNSRSKNAILALAESLDRSTGPFYRGKFTSRMSQKAKIITYAFEGEKTDATNTTAALMSVLYRILKAIEKDGRKAGRNLVVFHNMHTYADNKRALHYIIQIYKRTESLGATTLTITQATDDFLTNETLKRFLTRKSSSIALLSVPREVVREFQEKVWDK